MGNSGANIGCCSSDLTDESSAAIVEQQHGESFSSKDKRNSLQQAPETTSEVSVGDVLPKLAEAAVKTEFQRKNNRAKSWLTAEQLQSKSQVKTFTIELIKPTDKDVSIRLGFDIDYAEENNSLPIVDINAGLVGKWNEENPRTDLRIGDSIVAVNGIQGDVSKMLRSCSSSPVLELLVVRGSSLEAGLEPVASGLLAADAYFDQGKTKIANTNAAASGAEATEPEAALQRRGTAKKRTLTWAVKS